MSTRVRFDWEEAVAQDLDLQRIDAKGSRYESVAPSVKVEQLGPAQETSGTTPEFINIRDYTSESSSEIDMREVNPMDELSDFEPDPHTTWKSQDIDMDEKTSETACEVCKKSDREDEIMLCDDCNAEYHIFCLDPPLQSVPDESWYCPKCCDKYSTPSVVIKSENLVTTTIRPIPDNVEPNQNDPTAIPIAPMLENDPEKSNLLLIHACNCDEINCTHSEFQVLCRYMKRFLRCVCWVSHSDKWRSYRLARLTAELFAYHAMSCTVSQCNVPLCVKLREEEIV
ncbi:PHD Zn-finger protein [Plasmopara halstedii]|uniref:PHD Zn-finger protein n=1 Tax=Plasmopara halstedii TaxID=4781 RepID=A0A0N7L3K0_PLAHL|nr:PHD Zn-finger protein [Plasmopara halstedii]CEG36091.1 PHD Zn-finger protein [Plasmopara halstedii]|eukprot:XP_024572460.1 PHD Zn-finger protein [Plasmopara halstedii]